VRCQLSLYKRLPPNIVCGGRDPSDWRQTTRGGKVVRDRAHWRNETYTDKDHPHRGGPLPRRSILHSRYVYAQAWVRSRRLANHGQQQYVVWPNPSPSQPSFPMPGSWSGTLASMMHLSTPVS
jgi:hypothetical protein